MNLETPARPIIVHPTDFAPGDASAMAHALAMAMASKSILRLLQVRVDDEAFFSPTQGLRQVRDILVGWNVLAPDASYDHWEKDLGLQVSSASIAARNARAGILEYLEDAACNLVVLANYPHKASNRWLDVSVHSSLLRKGRMMSLFLREGQRRFIHPDGGGLKLKTILVPVASAVDSVPAIRRIQAMLAMVGSHAELKLLHIGKEAPALIDENGAPLNLPIMVREGGVVEMILATAGMLEADVIAMPTVGRHGLIDAVRGSTTARILEDARWPLLAVPVG
jgi:nucleotide-binding universal stress UspA family protein